MNKDKYETLPLVCFRDVNYEGLSLDENKIDLGCLFLDIWMCHEERRRVAFEAFYLFISPPRSSA